MEDGFINAVPKIKVNFIYRCKCAKQNAKRLKS